ncbi:MAG: hypothetical protein JWL77_2511 [Chthonomonadaceae bacterium]|nr:hypothetical protein [Chthonomonadaceae bacterium]
MSSDIEERDHAFDAPSVLPGADRQQDAAIPPPDTAATDTSAPIPDSSDQTVNAGDALPRSAEQTATSDVQRFKIRDASGHEYVVSGDPEGCLRYNHQQGDNELGYQGTCGLCSVQDVADQYGLNLTENDVVRFAADHHLCSTDGTPDQCGGTDIYTQAELLTDMQIMAQPVQGMTIDELAKDFESGNKIIIETNAGELFQGILPDSQCAQLVGPDPHAYNHAVTVTGVVRDPQTGAVVGIFINDTGANKGAQFISAAVLQQSWVGTGGNGVVAYGPVGGHPATPPAAPNQNTAPDGTPPQSLPHIIPRGDAPGDNTATPESEKTSAMPAILLPLVAIAALRARNRPKPKS